MRVALATLPRSEGKGPNKTSRVGFLPPLGLAVLAAGLEREGHRVLIVDSFAQGLGFEELIGSLRSFSPSIVGLTFTSPQRNIAYRFAARFKDQSPSTILVAGGPHATCDSEDPLLTCPSIDVVISGEGERSFPQFVRMVATGEQVEDIPGVWIRKKNQIVGKPAQRETFGMDTLPFPARDLLDLAHYIPEPHESRFSPSTTMIVTRGCSYSLCTFCLRSGPFKRTYRVKSVKQTIVEIEMLQSKYGIKEIQFYDDDLFSHREWIEEFSLALLQSDLELSWFARGRPSAIAHETLKLAKRAGLYGLEIGFESGNQETLDLVKKGVTLDQSRAVARWTHQLGIEVVGNFILGFPEETPEMGEQTIRFAKQLDPTFAIFIPLHPEPGTKIYDVAKKAGTFLEDPYRGPSFRSRFFPSVSFVPKDFGSAQELESLLKKAFVSFYMRPSKILRYLGELRSPDQVRRYWRGLSYFMKVAI